MTLTVLFLFQTIAILSHVLELKILSFSMNSLSKTIMVPLIKGNPFSIFDTFTELLSRRHNYFLIVKQTGVTLLDVVTQDNIFSIP